MLGIPNMTVLEHLALPRLGAALLAKVPGAMLLVSGTDGDVAIGAHCLPGAQVPPCQHRAALATALDSGDITHYLRTLGLGGDAVGAVRFCPPPRCELGGGVYQVQNDGSRDVLFATVLCPDTTKEAIANASTYPAIIERARRRDIDDSATSALASADVRIEFDWLTHVSVVQCTHAEHPTLGPAVEDAAVAAAAACALAELLVALR